MYDPHSHDNTDGNISSLSRLYTFTIISFLTILLAGGVLFFVLPKSSVSAIEKRELAKLPTFSAENLLSGRYTRELSAYFADNFPFREALVTAGASFRDLYGIRPDDIRLHVPEVQPPAPEPEAPTPGNPAPEVIYPPDGSSSVPPALQPIPTPVPEDNGRQVGGLFIYKGKALQIFGGNSSVGKRYAATVNTYQQLLGDGVQVYNLIIPSAIEFVLPEKYKKVTTPEHPKILEIYGQLDAKVKPVDIYDGLKAHSDEYLYFNTDHHWTARAAYYAYVEFAKVAGFTPVELDHMEKRVLKGFLGSLYAQTQDSKLRDNPDYVEYFMIDNPHSVYHYYKGSPYYPSPSSLYGEYAKSPNSYSVFLHGDFPMIRVTTELKNGRKIAVIKESYGNAFVPFLVNHYEEVIVVDPRYFERSFLEVVKEFGINEVLLINNSFAAHTGGQINMLNQIIYNVRPPASSEEPTEAAEQPVEQPVEQQEPQDDDEPMVVVP